jgi:predicted hydrocarbon binding protein
LTNRKRGSDVVSKEVLIGHVEPGARLAQVVVKMTDTVGAVASVNALLASLKVDVRQSMAHSLPREGNAIYNAFVVLTDEKVSLEQVIEKLKLSPFVITVQAFEGREGAIVDTLSFPVGWQGRRVVILAQYAMARMLDGIRGLLGTGGHVVLYELGTDYGRELANYFANRLGREYLLHNYPYWLDVLSATGWGVPELKEPEGDFPNATIRLSSCIECEGRSSREAVCSFVRGFLAGIYSELAGYTVHCEETKCAARGEGHCEFQLRSGRSVIAR